MFDGSVQMHSSRLSRVSSPPGEFQNRTLLSRIRRPTMTFCRSISEHDLADVLVVGSGLAGLSATLTLMQDNVPVVLIEADAALGGNSCKASSGMNSMTPAMDDSRTHFVNDVLSSGGDLCDRGLVDILVRDSEEALRFIEGVGVDMSKVSQLGGHSHARTHRNTSGPNVGFAIMKVLNASHMWQVLAQQHKDQLAMTVRLVSAHECHITYVSGVAYTRRGMCSHYWNVSSGMLACKS